MTPWRWAIEDKEQLQNTFLLVGDRLVFRCNGFNAAGELLDVDLSYPRPGFEPGTVYEHDGQGSSKYVSHRLKVPIREIVRMPDPERDRWVNSLGRAYWCGTGWIDAQSEVIPNMPTTFVISVR